MKTGVVLIALLHAACLMADDTVEMRQVVIRGAELEIVRLMTDPASKSGEEIYASLRQAVQAGRASLISDISTVAEDRLPVKVSQGRHLWLVTERDQDFDRLYLPPAGFEEYFVGTSLEAGLKMNGPNAGVFANWTANCSPCGPVLTRWPTSWLRTHTRDHKPHPQNQVVRGWLDNQDLFTESVVGAHVFEDSNMRVLAVTPPGDRVWPGDPRPGRLLDVFLGQIRAAEPEPAPAQPNRPMEAPPEAGPDTDLHAPHGRKAAVPMRLMMCGIALDAADAALLMAERNPADDGTLLQRLLARVQEGRARLQVCVGLTGRPGIQGMVSAGRRHQYPTEMPSIPSAWNERLVGTHLETDGHAWTLNHDLGPPRRSEWPLALDDPKAVMWEPRFRSLTISATLPAKRGVHLVSLQRIPEVMSGDGIAKDETVLLFAEQHNGSQPEPGLPPSPTLEAELLVLEVPGAEPADFEGLPGDPLPDDDDARFQHFLNRLKTGEVSVAAHAMVSGPPGRSNVHISEEFMHATEFDPPETKDTPRMRPTALDVVHAGDRWEIETSKGDFGHLTIDVSTSFTHTTGIPIEPGLEAVLAVAARGRPGERYPDMEHPVETWAPENHLTLTPGKVFCLGVRKPEGTRRKALHVAYIRVREVD